MSVLTRWFLGVRKNSAGSMVRRRPRLGCEVLEGRELLSGGLARFSLPAGPVGTSTYVGPITAGPDGNVWFVEAFDTINRPFTTSNAIARITPTGVVSTVVPSSALPATHVYSLTTGSDGNAWFGGFRSVEGSAFQGVVGRVTPAGGLTVFVVPNAFTVDRITPGRDGNLWITATGSNTGGASFAASVTPSGTITEFPLPGTPYNITASTSDRHGNLWVGFTLASLVISQADKTVVERITPTGKVTRYVLPPYHVPAAPIDGFGLSHPAYHAAITINGLATGADGNVWISEGTNSSLSIPRFIARVTPSGKFSQFKVLPRGVEGDPGLIVAGPGRQLSFMVAHEFAVVSYRQFKIGRISTTGHVSLVGLPKSTDPQVNSTSISITAMTTGSDGNLWFVINVSKSGGIQVMEIDRLTVIDPRRHSKGK